MTIKIQRNYSDDNRITTTMGLRAARDLLCFKCNERKPGVFTVNAQGQQVCPECAGSVAKGVLNEQCCDPESCACGQPLADG